MKSQRILFIDLSTALKTVGDLELSARGGMVSSLFKISDYLSGRGHKVSVIGGIEQPGRTAAGVAWFSKATFPQDSAWDFLILNRGAMNGLPEISARRRILWTHDLPHAGMIPEPMILNAFAATVFMSEYAERIWRAFFKTIGRSFMIPNGVDKGLFHPREKDERYIIFASAPNRGLKRLPLIYDALKTRATRPFFMRAFSNMGKMHPHEKLIRDDEQDGYSLEYKSCLEVGIDLRDPIPQVELAEELGRAWVMVMPTDYPEICSNIVLQSLASGTPIITTGGIGSAPEWVKDGRNGRLTRFQPVDYMIHTVEIVRYLMEAINEPQRWQRLIKGATDTKVHTWDEIGAKWERMIWKLS